MGMNVTFTPYEESLQMRYLFDDVTFEVPVHMKPDDVREPIPATYINFIPEHDVHEKTLFERTFDEYKNFTRFEEEGANENPAEIHVHFGTSTLFRYDETIDATLLPKWVIDVPGTGMLHIYDTRQWEMQLHGKTSLVFCPPEHVISTQISVKGYVNKNLQAWTQAERRCRRKDVDYLWYDTSYRRDIAAIYHVADVFDLTRLFGLQL
ncbi:uncharacterized protein LOC143908704 [Temnothorax americanus]|uniref:uncharacterized protein LOC143908704 n=1 Tax=Temnothorax americanus TaxID=1964332 RepID=UPI004069135E